MDEKLLQSKKNGMPMLLLTYVVVVTLIPIFLPY